MLHDNRFGGLSDSGRQFPGEEMKLRESQSRGGVYGRRRNELEVPKPLYALKSEGAARNWPMALGEELVTPPLGLSPMPSLESIPMQDDHLRAERPVAGVAEWDHIPSWNQRGYSHSDSSRLSSASSWPGAKLS